MIRNDGMFESRQDLAQGVMRSELARLSSVQTEPGGCRRALVVLASVAIALFLSLNSWSHCQWATLRDEVQSYESLVRRFPDSDFKPPAKERIRVLVEPEVWAQDC